FACGVMVTVAVGSAPNKGTPTGKRLMPIKRGASSKASRTIGTNTTAIIDSVKCLCFPRQPWIGSVVRTLFLRTSSVVRCLPRAMASLETCLCAAAQPGALERVPQWVVREWKRGGQQGEVSRQPRNCFLLAMLYLQETGWRPKKPGATPLYCCNGPRHAL